MLAGPDGLADYIASHYGQCAQLHCGCGSPEARRVCSHRRQVTARTWEEMAEMARAMYGIALRTSCPA
jgi:hypothetical protein